jgi:hypothetical protein
MGASELAAAAGATSPSGTSASCTRSVGAPFCPRTAMRPVGTPASTS